LDAHSATKPLTSSPGCTTFGARTGAEEVEAGRFRRRRLWWVGGLCVGSSAAHRQLAEKNGGSCDRPGGTKNCDSRVNHDDGERASTCRANGGMASPADGQPSNGAMSWTDDFRTVGWCGLETKVSFGAPRGVWRASVPQIFTKSCHCGDGGFRLSKHRRGDSAVH